MTRWTALSGVTLVMLLSASASSAYSAESETPRLEYRPFARAMYHVSVTGTDNLRCHSPQVLVLDKDSLREGSFTVTNMRVGHQGGDPNRDLVGDHGLKFSRRGLALPRRDPDNPHAIIGPLLAARPYLFPMFAEGDGEPKKGNSWEVKCLPVGYELGAFSAKAHADHCLVKFKWVDTVRVGEFTCAKIQFSIKDRWEDENSGETYNFSCTGASYFAIKQGVIVSEWLEANHDLKVPSDEAPGEFEKKTVTSSKKVRLLHYEPYQPEAEQATGTAQEPAE